MAEFPALPLWTDAYLADTLDLTDQEHGLYLVMMMIAWRRPDCALPDDMDWLKRALQACCRGLHGRTFNSIVPRLLTRFWSRNESENGAKWVQKRLEKERKYLQNRSERQSKRSRDYWDSKRLEKAAGVESGNPPTPTPTPTPTQEESQDSPSLGVLSDAGPKKATAKDVMEAWNAMAERIGLPTVNKLTEARRKAALGRLADAGGLEGICAAFELVAASPFLRGERSRGEHAGWQADFDFVVKAKNFTRLMEGRFNDNATVGRQENAIIAGFAAALAERQRAREAANAECDGRARGEGRDGDCAAAQPLLDEGR